MIVIATEPIRSCHVFWSMLMNMMVFDVPAKHHCAWYRRNNTDVQIGQMIKPFTTPNPQMDMVVMDDLHSDRYEQQNQKRNPVESPNPLHTNQHNVQNEVQQRL